MFSDFINKIESHFRAGLPFVAYRKPGESLLNGLLQKNTTLYSIDDFEEKGFVFAPFDSNFPTILLKPDEILECDLKNYQYSSFGKGLQVDINTKENQSYLRTIKKAIAEIENGTFKKIVLSRVVEVNSSDNPFKIFERILAIYDAAFCYIWYHPKIGLWMGATPETLIKIVNNSLDTNSLAGTKVYQGSMNPAWGKKEIHEQQIVTDYILEALSNEVLDIKTSDVETVKAGNLLHLKTHISGKCSNKSLSKILERLHPTPAVCGVPKETSKEFIRNNEDYNREYYTGFLGELNMRSVLPRTSQRKNVENNVYQSIKTSTELYVNLRCMQLKNNRAFIYVGGGITKDSIPDKEWEETVNKSKTILKVLS